jgi:hypothetical protein
VRVVCVVECDATKGHAMRKVFFAYANESERMSAQLNELRSILGGNIEVIEPDSPNTGSNSTAESLLKKAMKADFVVILFSAAPEHFASVSSAGQSPKPGEESAKPPAVTVRDTRGRIPSLTSQERERLPDQVTRLIVIFRANDWERLPEDLKGFPYYDYSSREGCEALLCRLVHDPVSPRSRIKEEAASAGFKVCLGAVATLVGNTDKMKDFLLDQFGESLSQAVHYCMALAVLVLLFIGLVALFRLGINLLRPVIHISGLEGLPGRPTMWRGVIVGVTSVLVIIFAFYFLPRAPDIDENVKKHVEEWAKRLERSQRPNGGIGEHPDRGFAQVWSTSQSLAGLLSPQSATTINPTDVQRAFSFIERTRITNLELKGDKRNDLAQHLAQYMQQGNFSKLPPRFPTFALVLRVLGRIPGGTELTPEAVRMLEENRDQYFTEGLFEGWGYYEQFDWSVTEVGAWVAIAAIQSLRAINPLVWTTEQSEEIKRRVRDIIQLLGKRQIPQVGAFSPMADTSDVSFARTYSTVMALWAMAEAVEMGMYQGPELAELHSRMSDAVRWLSSSAALVEGKGWKVNPANPTDEEPFLGLTAQTLSVLGRVPIHIDRQSRNEFARVKRYLLSTASDWTRRSLQDNDRMHDSDCYLYPTQYVIEPSTFLWYPWGVSLMRSFSTDQAFNLTEALTAKERNTAAKWLKRLHARAGEFGKFVESEYNYVAAEALIGFRWTMDVRNVTQ